MLDRRRIREIGKKIGDEIGNKIDEKIYRGEKIERKLAKVREEAAILRTVGRKHPPWLWYLSLSVWHSGNTFGIPSKGGASWAPL